METPTIVIFRRDRDGHKDCFALFPELPADNQGRFCSCFQHVGQHCAADYHGCIGNSNPAKPAEYANLQRELEHRGYILAIRQRATPRMHKTRRQEAIISV